MQEFNEGDLVQAVKGEVHITDRLVRSRFGDEHFYLPAMKGGTYVDALVERGWAVTVIEGAAPKALPDNTVIRRTDGVVYVSNGEDYFNVYGNVSPAIATKGGYKILAEPVPVTAKKVLDALRARIGSIDSAHDFQSVAAQFGVEA